MIPTLLDEAPAVWDGMHVGLRLTEAMRTLRAIPMAGAAGYGGTWPAYAYEFEDLLAQHEQGELERTQQQQNRTRLMPSLVEISRMEVVIQWPACFLAAHFELCRAVNIVAWAHALDRDSGWVAAKHGGYAETWFNRYVSGCDRIAAGLQARLFPVF